jgi:hypothetical protein
VRSPLKLLLPLALAIGLLSIILKANLAEYNFAFYAVGDIPYGDKMMHMLLFGVMAWGLNYGLNFKKITIHIPFALHLPKGSLYVALFATLEETSQLFISSRTFDTGDLIANLIGITLFSLKRSPLLDLGPILLYLLMLLKILFILYPALIITFVILDPLLKQTGQSLLVPLWFQQSTQKYNHWADAYQKNPPKNIEDNQTTEWAVMGSIFHLLNLSELAKNRQVHLQDPQIDKSLQHAIAIITSPTASVWLDSQCNTPTYAHIFHRLLLIHAINTYQRLAQSDAYETRVVQEIAQVAHHLKESTYPINHPYPKVCVDCNTLLHEAMIDHRHKRDQREHEINNLNHTLMHLVDQQLSRESNEVLFRQSRGSNTATILLFAPSFDIKIAQRWYQLYLNDFWKETPWLVGFKEFAHRENPSSLYYRGFILHEISSVASLFGIGASKSLGHFKQTVPLTMESVAFAYPTPFGFLLPSIGGKVLVDSWAIGEVMMLFPMLRPLQTNDITPFTQAPPLSVLLMAMGLWVLGMILLVLDIHWVQRYYRQKRSLREEVL